MNIMNKFNDIRNTIINWQKENDNEFKAVPNDEHSALIFNHYGQEIIKFIFSNKEKRELCRRAIHMKIEDKYHLYLEQEEGFTYYLFKN